MCGIMGYIGSEQAAPILLNGLNTLEHRGYVFRSETDTEVVAHLVEYCDCGNLVDTLIRVMQRIEGSYALGVMSVDAPDRFVAVRKDSPLIAAAGASITPSARKCR